MSRNLQGPVHPCRDMSVADRDLLGCFQKREEGEDGSVLEHQMPVGLEPLLQTICHEEQTNL